MKSVNHVASTSVAAHVVWDWNGTLLADTDLAHEAFNASLVSAGLAALDRAECSVRYRRPLLGFYEEVFARSISEEEWIRIDETFQAAYRSGLHDVRLAPGAVDVLRSVRRGGRTQSLLSMAPHDALLEAAASWKVEHHFDLVQGHRGVPGAPKAALLREHWKLLAGRYGYDPRQIVVVGDTCDDADAAAALGAWCILVDSGTQSVDALRRTDNVVVSDLAGVLAQLDALS